LYGNGLGFGRPTVKDVTLVGAKTGPISGSLLMDAPYTSITFHATANGLLLLNNFGSVVLPDDTYTVTLVSGSGSNGFLDALGAGLDGANTGGHADYTAVFTTNSQAAKTQVLALPDFARGPNNTGFSVPVTLYNAS